MSLRRFPAVLPGAPTATCQLLDGHRSGLPGSGRFLPGRYSPARLSVCSMFCGAA